VRERPSNGIRGVDSRLATNVLQTYKSWASTS